MVETLEIVVNEWCPERRLDLVKSSRVSRPTQQIDPEFLKQYANLTEAEHALV